MCVYTYVSARALEAAFAAWTDAELEVECRIECICVHACACAYACVCMFVCMCVFLSQDLQSCILPCTVQVIHTECTLIP